MLWQLLHPRVQPLLHCTAACCRPATEKHGRWAVPAVFFWWQSEQGGWLLLDVCLCGTLSQAHGI